jgi:uncharacterized protein YcaQ
MKVYERAEVKKMLLQYHNLDGNEKLIGIEGVRKIMTRLGSIQYDPLNVVGRNADLVLQARVDGYRPEYLYSLLYEEHSLVDGFDKEMCIYNTKDFSRFSRVREEHASATLKTLEYRGQMGALEILDDVKTFVFEHGLTGTKDISIGEVRESRWGHKKLSSAALDFLYNKGELCVAEKRGTQKYFDLTERIIPSDFNKMDNMSIDDFLDWYVTRRIQSLGLAWDKNGGAWQGHFLSDKELRKKVLDRLVEKNAIYTFQIDGITNTFYACNDLNFYSNSKEYKDYARFIAPLDNIMWDRTMLEKIFDFSYRWEVYTPVSKRKYGYYVIPVIYNDCFVARFEPEPIGKIGCFSIKNWWWETNIHPDDRMRMVIMNEMNRFSEYLQVECSEKNKMKIGE